MLWRKYFKRRNHFRPGNNVRFIDQRLTLNHEYKYKKIINLIIIIIIIWNKNISYAGNCDIQMRIKGMKAGIKHFQLYGIVRVELRPLLKDLPLVGCVSFYFLNNPNIEFNLTNLADILDMPGLR